MRDGGDGAGVGGWSSLISCNRPFTDFTSVFHPKVFADTQLGQKYTQIFRGLNQTNQ